jgi:hypothetical protein
MLCWQCLRRRFSGAEAVGEFFATVPGDGDLTRVKLVPARANLRPALAAYFDGWAFGIMVFELRDGRIAEVVGFADAAKSFSHFGLPSGSKTWARLIRPADVAQLVEHFTRNEGVPGSSPGVGSPKTRWKRRVSSCLASAAGRGRAYKIGVCVYSGSRAA